MGSYGLSVTYRLGDAALPPIEQEFPKPVAVLFNPWEGYAGQRDKVYLGNSTELDEYLVKQHGYIWKGEYLYDSKGTIDYHSIPWLYDQFRSPQCLNTVLEFLGGLDVKLRQDPEFVARYFTAIANPSGGGTSGLLYGLWPDDPKDFAPYELPWNWRSSGQIFRQYVKNGQTSVRYGQCWVFGGVLTSMLRAVGIPARPVTNFNSAHSTDSRPGQIDKYYFQLISN